MKIRLILVSLLFSMTPFLYANLSEKEVTHGQVTFSRYRRNLEVLQKSDQAIIHWNEFSIRSDQKVRFIQPEGGVVLNRVVGDLSSVIAGILQANGKVYLINEKGIFIKGEIKTQSFVASCLNFLDQEFLLNETINLQGNNKSVIKNHGLIQAEKGNVILVAREVENHGKIRTKDGFVGLAGATDVLLTEKDQEPIFIRVTGEGSILNAGKIEALRSELISAGGNIFGFAINQKGVIEAKDAICQNGRIVLSAKKGEIHVSGELLANSEDKGGTIQVIGGDLIHLEKSASVQANGINGGGMILIGGDFQGKNPEIANAKRIYVAKGVKLEANCFQNGNGGKVITWADNQNLFGGQISAKGGIEGGDGGLVEISSPMQLLYQGSVTTKAPQGKVGTLLFDPSNIRISAQASNPIFPTGPGEYNPVVSDAILNATDLVTGLGSSDVVISTAAGSGGNGRVRFLADVIWSAATRLTVNARRTIILNGVTIRNTNSTDPNFLAINLRANQAGSPVTGNFNGIRLDRSTIRADRGNINLIATGGTANNNQGIKIFRSTIRSDGTGPQAGAITLDGTAGAGTNGLSGIGMEKRSTITAVGGDISITGLSNATGNYNHGIVMSSRSTVSSTGGAAGAAQITLDGTSATGPSENNGINMETGALVTSQSGNIGITALSNGTSNYSKGLSMIARSRITSTGTGSNAATITVNATSGTGEDVNLGGFIQRNSEITSIDGNILIIPISRGTGTTRNHGLLVINSNITSTGTTVDAADLTINSTAGAGTPNGVRGIRNADISVDPSGGGTLTITGGFLND